MAKSPTDQESVPKNMQAAFEAVVNLTDVFCQEHLNAEYAVLCRKMAGVLCRLRPSPLARGNPAGWAAGIVSVVGRTNFLDDPSQHPYMKIGDIGPKFGIGASTAAAKASQIRRVARTGPLELEWQLPSRLRDHPLAWMIQVNGLLVDARSAPREIQEEAFRLGLIPFVPGEEGTGE